MDTSCSPACSKFGPYAYFAEQYDSLAAISSIGRSNYNGMNLTLRRRFSDGLQFDINYTLAKSEDMGSQVERGSAFGNFSNGGNTGFLINSFDPELNYGTSDFDVRHQINTNWLAELPFGQGKRFGGGAGGALNAFIGDWSIAGLMRWTSGFPFNVANCRSCWATNWNLQGNAMLVDPNGCPRPRPRRTRSTAGRARSPMRPTRSRYFRRQLPGEVGRPQPVPRRRLLQHRPEPQQGVPGRHRRPPAALPLGRVQRHQHGEVRRRPADHHAGHHRLRPLQRHAGHLRRAGGTLHAVRAALRVLDWIRAQGSGIRESAILIPDP